MFMFMFAVFFILLDQEFRGVFSLSRIRLLIVIIVYKKETPVFSFFFRRKQDFAIESRMASVRVYV